MQSLYSNTTGNIAVGFVRSIATPLATTTLPLAAKRFVTTLQAAKTLPLAISRSKQHYRRANTVCGFLAGDIITTGSRNVIIGQGNLIHRRKTEMIKSSSVTL
jgi:hypothetical protein